MRLTELLNQVLQIKGVTSAAVVSGSGDLVEGASQDEVDLAFVAGLLTSSLASARVLAGLLGEGELIQTMLEYERGPVLLTPLRPYGSQEDGPVLVVMLDAAGSLGRVRFQLRKLLPEIAAALPA